MLATTFTSSRSPSLNLIVLLLCAVFIMLSSRGAAAAGVGQAQGGIYAILRSSDPLHWFRSLVSSDSIDGITYYMGLSNVNPEKGVYDWRYLDYIVDMSAQHQKELRIAILPGRWVPQWYYEDGVTSFTWTFTTALVDAGTYSATAPVPWDTMYLERLKEMVVVLGERYSANPAVASVQITGPALTNGLEANLNLSDADLQRIGFDPTLLSSAWKQMIDAYDEAFPDKLLTLALHDQIGAARNRQIPRELREYAYSRLGDRFSPMVAYLTHEPWFSRGNPTVDIWAEAAGRMPLTAQMIDIYSEKGYPPELLAAAVAKAKELGAVTVEVWAQDLMYAEYRQAVQSVR